MQNWDAEEILENIFLGSEDAAHADVKFLKEKGITHILTCGIGLMQIHPNDMIYHRIKAVDLPIYDIRKDLDSCIKFIREALTKGKVLVHCARGVSRSASVVTAFVMIHNNASFAEAYHLVRSKRNVVSINSGFEKQLKEWEKTINVSK